MSSHEQSTLIDQDWLKDINLASSVLSKRGSPVRDSELTYDNELSEILEATIYIADDTHQETGSFKIRGAYMGVRSLDYHQRIKGLETASAGNFGAGVAQSCRILGVEGKIWVPLETPTNKIDNIKKFGGKKVEVYKGGANFDQAEELAKASSDKNDRFYLPPFDNRQVITGQGTWGSEIVRGMPKGKKIDYIFSTVGGGGLATGVSMAVKSKYPEAKIIGVEPEGAASLTHARSLGRVASLEGSIDTFVDGAAVSQIGRLAFEYGNPLIDDVVVVPNLETRQATTYLWERDYKPKRVELAAGLALAGLLKYGSLVKGSTAVVLLSGQNLSQERYEKEVRV